jgi:hypothetical protein
MNSLSGDQAAGQHTSLPQRKEVLKYILCIYTLQSIIAAMSPKVPTYYSTINYKLEE